MNYDEMSDFEINAAVADALFIYWHSAPKNNPESKWLYSENYHLCDTKTNPAVDLPDYCNDPADAWPIIVENKICIESGHPVAEGWCAYRHEFVPPDDFQREYNISGKNPLRCAMIVFLEMQEQSDEN